MAPSGPPVARVATGLLAVLVAVVVAVGTLSADVRLDGLSSALARIGVGAVVVGVVMGWASFGATGALFLGGAFVATRFEEPVGLDHAVVWIGPALLLVCELVSWSTDARTSRAPGVPAARRATTLALAITAAAGLTAVVAAVSTLPIGDALGLAALGAASVVLVAAAIVRSARSVASRP